MIRDVVKALWRCIHAKRVNRGDVDHTFLTSIIDPNGILRVQHRSYRFDPEEILRDLQPQER